MSEIEWTDRTWNPVVGCSRVSAGCEHCYAERVAHRAMQPTHAGLTVAGAKGPRWTGEVRCLPERLEQPLRWRKPRRIFVNSMSDLFHDGVPDDFIDRVFAVMALCPQHTFQVITKRPERMYRYVFSRRLDARSMVSIVAAFVGDRNADAVCDAAAGRWHDGLSNLWLGVSVEDQATANQRVPLLLQTPAAVRFVSAEPLLGPVDLNVGRTLGAARDEITEEDDALGPPLGGVDGIDWVIVGGESGPGARPCDVEWIRSVVRQCREAQVPVFCKQVGSRPFTSITTRPAGECAFRFALVKHRKGGEPAEWPEDIRVREMPEVNS